MSIKSVIKSTMLDFPELVMNSDDELNVKADFIAIVWPRIAEEYKDSYYDLVLKVFEHCDDGKLDLSHDLITENPLEFIKTWQKYKVKLIYFHLTALFDDFVGEYYKMKKEAYFSE